MSDYPMTQSISTQDNNAIPSTSNGLTAPLLQQDEELRREKAITTCLRRWIIPIIVVSISICFIALGITCRFITHHFSNVCPAILLPIGFCTPIIYFFVAIYVIQRSKKQLMQEDFYSNALLEEWLSGESFGSIYSISNRPTMNRKKVVVFLSGVGSSMYNWEYIRQAIIDQNCCVVLVQLPGSGVLRGVNFSIKRATRVVERVLEYEFSEMENLSFILVANNLSTRVALRFCKTNFCKRHHVGLALKGSELSILPRPLGIKERLTFSATRLPWMKELIIRAEYNRLRSTCVHALRNRKLLNPGARQDWSIETQTTWQEDLNRFKRYQGPMLVLVSNSSALKTIQMKINKKVNNKPNDDTMQCIVDRTKSRNTMSKRQLDSFCKYLVQFLTVFDEESV